MAAVQIAQWLAQSKRVVVLTGAGISTDSGIPDFRSPGGVWSQSQPVYFQEFLRSDAARREYWRQKSLTHVEFQRAQPNAGHLRLAEWQARGFVQRLLTQNIDGLHSLAGSRQVLEIHGTAREVACLSCGFREDADAWVRQFLKESVPPPCPDCGGWLKHATISFGQNLDPDVLAQAQEASEQADLFLAIGSSLVVHPAAGLPRLAHQQGARLVIINRDPTPLDSVADLACRASISDLLCEIDALLPQHLP